MYPDAAEATAGHNNTLANNTSHSQPGMETSQRENCKSATGDVALMRYGFSTGRSVVDLVSIPGIVCRISVPIPRYLHRPFPAMHAEYQYPDQQDKGHKQEQHSGIHCTWIIIPDGDALIKQLRHGNSYCLSGRFHQVNQIVVKCRQRHSEGEWQYDVFVGLKA